MTVITSIRVADALLSGRPNEADSMRWQAVSDIADYIPDEPEPIWDFVRRWGNHPLEDLRDAIATLLLEHLLEYHFDLIFPRVEATVESDRLFADMFCRCWRFGQAEVLANSHRFDELQKRCRKMTLSNSTDA